LSRLKNTRGFSDQFFEILELSKEQIEKINVIEYNLYKEYYWDHSNPEPNYKLKFIRKVGRILSDQQWKKLKIYRDKSKENKLLKEQESLNKIIEFEKSRLKSLALKEYELKQLAEFKIQIPVILREKRLKNQKSNFDIEKLRAQLEKENISKFLNSDQLVQYDKIVTEELDKKTKWVIKFSSERFEQNHKIKLEESQKEKVYLIEDRSFSFNEMGEIYSEFEQAEAKFEAYKSILNEEQFIIYHQYYNNLISNIKDRIIESDEERVVYLNRISKYFDFYVANILPKTTEASKKIKELLSVKENHKIDLLKFEYFKIMQKNFKKSHDQFEKHTRNLALNEMKEHKIRYQLDLIRPNGYVLKDSNLAIKLLSPELIELLNSATKNLEPDYAKLKEYQIEVYEKSDGEYGGGFMYKTFPTEKELKFANLGLLLLDNSYEKNLERINAIDNTRS